MQNHKKLPTIDSQIVSLENLEIFPGITLKNMFNADLEGLCNVRGLSGNSGTHPFFDCFCSQANRNLPKEKRQPCQIRTIESCYLNHEKWREETKGNKKGSISLLGK